MTDAPYRELTKEDHKFICDVLSICSGAMFIVSQSPTRQSIPSMITEHSILAKSTDALRARFFADEPEEVAALLANPATEFVFDLVDKFREEDGVTANNLLAEIDRAFEKIGAKSLEPVPDKVINPEDELIRLLEQKLEQK